MTQDLMRHAARFLPVAIHVKAPKGRPGSRMGRNVEVGGWGLRSWKPKQTRRREEKAQEGQVAMTP